MGSIPTAIVVQLVLFAVVSSVVLAATEGKEND